MASILERYGIKEVADVTFYNINEDGSRGAPVLYLDTLKVSTIEQTAETADARGGKGNPKLITWDYGKDITVTLEDALFSAKSLSIMFGDGSVKEDGGSKVTRTVMARLDSTGKLASFTTDVYDPETKGATRRAVKIGEISTFKISNLEVFNEKSEKLTSSTYDYGTDMANARVFVTYQIAVGNNKEIVVSADTFPGTYYVAGDTYARSDVTGADQFFQFIIEKAKVTSENTITLEAEGDPSVFNMNLTVLRPESGHMMKLVQYDLSEEETIAISGPARVATGKDITLYTDAADPTDVTWAALESDDQIVTLERNEDGSCTVTAGSTEGASVITATLSNGATDEHIVRVFKVN